MTVLPCVVVLLGAGAIILISGPATLDVRKGLAGVQAVISKEAAKATPSVSMMYQLLFIGSPPQYPTLLKNPS
jgi:hypothetical protein